MSVKLIVLAGVGCGSGTCPTVYETETGEIVIQGRVLDESVRASMRIPESEDAVVIPRELLAQAIAALERQG